MWSTWVSRSASSQAGAVGAAVPIDAAIPAGRVHIGATRGRTNRPTIGVGARARRQVARQRRTRAARQHSLERISFTPFQRGRGKGQVVEILGESAARGVIHAAQTRARQPARSLGTRDRSPFLGGAVVVVQSLPRYASATPGRRRHRARGRIVLAATSARKLISTMSSSWIRWSSHETVVAPLM